MREAAALEGGDGGGDGGGGGGGGGSGGDDHPLTAAEAAAPRSMASLTRMCTRQFTFDFARRRCIREAQVLARRGRHGNGYGSGGRAGRRKGAAVLSLPMAAKQQLAAGGRGKGGLGSQEVEEEKGSSSRRRRIRGRRRGRRQQHVES